MSINREQELAWFNDRFCSGIAVLFEPQDVTG